MKELNRTSRHAARDAWQTGELVKHTSRPRQTEHKPGNCHAERGKRNAQPHELMIDFTLSKAPSAKLHFLRINGAMRSRHPARRT